MKPFPWRPGMRAIDAQGRPWRLYVGAVGLLCAQGEPEGYVARWAGSPESAGTRPDPDDGATRGALLDAVREAWGFPDLYPRRMSEGRAPHVWSVTPPTGHEPPFREGWGFVVGCAKGQELARRVGIQPSEFAALLAAWEAAP